MEDASGPLPTAAASHKNNASEAGLAQPASALALEFAAEAHRRATDRDRGRHRPGFASAVQRRGSCPQNWPALTLAGTALRLGSCDAPMEGEQATFTVDRIGGGKLHLGDGSERRGSWRRSQQVCHLARRVATHHQEVATGGAAEVTGAGGEHGDIAGANLDVASTLSAQHELRPA